MRQPEDTKPTPAPDTNYRVTEIPISALKIAVGPIGAQAPRYDRERDEPAFDAAWRHVAELRAQGRIAPTLPIPPGGLRVPRPRQKETA